MGDFMDENGFYNSKTGIYNEMFDMMDETATLGVQMASKQVVRKDESQRAEGDAAGQKGGHPSDPTHGQAPAPTEERLNSVSGNNGLNPKESGDNSAKKTRFRMGQVEGHTSPPGTKLLTGEVKPNQKGQSKTSGLKKERQTKSHKKRQTGNEDLRFSSEKSTNPTSQNKHASNRKMENDKKTHASKTVELPSEVKVGSKQKPSKRSVPIEKTTDGNKVRIASKSIAASPPFPKTSLKTYEKRGNEASKIKTNEVKLTQIEPSSRKKTKGNSNTNEKLKRESKVKFNQTKSRTKPEMKKDTEGEMNTNKKSSSNFSVLLKNEKGFDSNAIKSRNDGVSPPINGNKVEDWHTFGKEDTTSGRPQGNRDNVISKDRKCKVKNQKQRSRSGSPPKSPPRHPRTSLQDTNQPTKTPAGFAKKSSLDEEETTQGFANGGKSVSLRQPNDSEIRDCLPIMDESSQPVQHVDHDQLGIARKQSMSINNAKRHGTSTKKKRNVKDCEREEKMKKKIRKARLVEETKVMDKQRKALKKLDKKRSKEFPVKGDTGLCSQHVVVDIADVVSDTCSVPPAGSPDVQIPAGSPDIQTPAGSPDVQTPAHRNASLGTPGSLFSARSSLSPEDSQLGNILDISAVDADPEFRTHLIRMIQERRSSHRGKQKGRRSLVHLEDGRSWHSVDDEEEGLANIYGEQAASSETKIRENIQLQKDIIARMRFQPLPMRYKLQALALAKAYVERYEGQLSKGHGYQETYAKVLHQIKRSFKNFTAMFIPWEMQIKLIESHFGTVVASFFTFLRWILSANILVAVMCLCVIVVPELLFGRPYGSTSSKTVPSNAQDTVLDLNSFLNFEGYVYHSLMFFGYYGDEPITHGFYRLPLAYFMGGVMSFVITFIVILRKMAENNRRSHGSSQDDQYTFSWPLFTVWDYMIGNSETSKNKTAEIVTSLRELIVEEEEKEPIKNPRLLKFQRVLGHFLCILILGGSAYAVWLTVQRSAEFAKILEAGGTITFLQANELNIVTSLSPALLPNLFDLVGAMEKYHPRVNLQFQLARILGLYLLNMATFLFGTYLKITDQIAAISTCNATLATPGEAAESATPQPNCTQTAAVCWESDLAQDIAKITLSDWYITVFMIIVIDFIRGFIVRYGHPYFPCWDLETQFPEYGEFKLAENLLHIINNQAFMWLGTFFSPLLPALNLVKLLSLHYLRAWAVRVCNIPPERVFKASRSNNFYYAITLLMLFLSCVAVLFIVIQLPPSRECGPFRRYERSYHVLTQTLEEELPSWAGSAMSYLVSPSIILPMIMVMAMGIYYFYTQGKYTKIANKQLQAQLQYERTEEKRKVYQMADAKNKEEERKLGLKNAKEKPEGKGSSDLANGSVPRVLA